MAPKTPDQLRQMVEEYIKITGVKYEDQTVMVQAKTKNIDWQFHVGGNVIISKNVNRQDRIHVNVNMRFTPEDAKLLVPSNQAFTKAAIEVSEIAATCKVGHQWVNAGNEIVGLAIFAHVDECILDRVAFHDTWDNVARVSGHVQKILHANLGRISKNMMHGSDHSPASTSSIYG